MGCSKHLILVISILYFVNAQENAQTRIPSSLLECYEDPRLLQRESQFPSTMNTFIDLIRKIENSPGLNMEIKNLAIALLHRFRLDGIIRASSFSSSTNMLPYSPKGFHFYKHRILLTNLIPGNGYSFPNNTLTPLERCTLHRILSNTVEENVRGDEGTVCNQLSQYRTQRLPRDINSDSDVEVINPETINEMNQKGNVKLSADVDGDVDFNIIPGVFANGSPDNTGSACPVETGVIKTMWGAVSAGTLLAGIAAGLEPLKISVSEISGKTSSDPSLERNKIVIDNKFAATLAGDLAEISIFQGPKTELNNQADINIGTSGGWNSTLAPKWYFLSQTKDYEFTAAEIRGGLDGLILGTYIQEFKSKASQLKLSQLLEMYYSQRGVFNNIYRACNRQSLMTSVTTTDDLYNEALGFTYILDKIIQHSVTIKDSGYVRYSKMATDSLMSYITTKLNDLSCSTTESHTSHNVQASTNIYIVLDSTWAYHDINPTLSYLLDNINISPLNSNVTLINARTAELIVNSTFYLSEFHENYNASVHSQQASGFDLPKSLDMIKRLQAEQLDREKRINYAGGRSSIALMVINMAVISDSDLRYSLDQLKIIYEQIPDVRFLYLVSGSRERFNNLVRDPSKDIFTLSPSNTESISQVNEVAKRIKEIPRRLINPRCGNNWVQSDAGSTALPEYVASPMINYYRLHPNYYYKLSYGSVKIQGHGFGTLNVCYSRYIELPRRSNISSENQDITCESVVTNTVEINLADACKGNSYIHKCAPLYISVEAVPVNPTVPRCIEKTCPFPDSIKYTIHLQELNCYSSASRAVTQIFVSILGLFISMKLFT